MYCNTASYGLPPRPAWEALQSALDEWHGGRTSWQHWGRSTEAARASFARLLDVDIGRVAAGSTVSELLGSVVAALPAEAGVVVPDVRAHLDAVPAAGPAPPRCPHGPGRPAGRRDRRGR